MCHYTVQLCSEEVGSSYVFVNFFSMPQYRLLTSKYAVPHTHNARLTQQMVEGNIEDCLEAVQSKIRSEATTLDRCTSVEYTKLLGLVCHYGKLCATYGELPCMFANRID